MRVLMRRTMKDPPVTEPKRVFGWRQIIPLIFAVVVTLLVVIYQDKLRGFEEYAYGGAFLAMLIGNSTVVLPVPGLIVVYILGGVLNPLIVGLSAGPGAALGEITGYAAGYSGSAFIENLELYNSIKRKMERYGPIVITLLAAFPNPVFDLAGLAAGSMRMSWWKFLIAVWIGKTIQGILVAYAGALSLSWIEQFLTH
jgi:membrane protein YqaA with SNARE-associated domain